MCDVSDSTIQELLLAKLSSPEHKDAGASQDDLTGATGACIVHTLRALRELHRSGHATAEGSDPSDDPVSDPSSRWKIAGAGGAAKSAEPKPRVVNSYTLLEELGRGRSGVVLRARHEVLRRDVAVKILSRENTANSALLQKFEREARILAHLEHPHIVRVHDAGQDAEGNFYLVMELVEEGSLVRYVKKNGRPSASVGLEWMIQIAGALGTAHKQGILHRDVKPDNIMLTPSGVKLGDFSLAALEEIALKESPSTFGGVESAPDKPPQVVGTYHYMAPERMNLERGDHRSDIYSFGATFYSVLSGHYIFDNLGNDYLKWRWHHNKETPLSVTDRVPGFPPSLSALLDRCLMKDPAHRYQSYDDLLADLENVRRELAGDGAAPTALVAPTKPRRRLSIMTMVFVLSAVVVATLIIARPWHRHRENEAVLKHQDDLKHESAPRKEGEPLRHEHAPESKPEEARKTEDIGTETAKDKESSSNKDKPKAEPRPLLDQLAEHDPTPSDLALLRGLIDLAARERPHFMARSYEPFRKGLVQLESQTASADDREKTFRAWHLNAARELADLSEIAVSSRLSELATSGRAVTLSLTDGRTLSGRVKAVEGDAILVTTDAGEERVPIANLAPSNFTGNADLWKASLAFQALSDSAAEALPLVLSRLPASEDLLLWIPIVVRLVREEARANATARAFTRAHQILDRLAALQPELPRVFACLEESDFRSTRDERDALKLFLEDRLAEIATRYPESLAYAPTTEKLLERFCARLLDEKDLLKRLAAPDPEIDKVVDDQRPKPADIYEKGITPPKRRLFDFVGGPACTQWTPEPQGTGWDRQGREKPAYVIIRHATDLQRLTYHGSESSASQGSVLVYRFVPGDLSARWRLGLETPAETRLYLQLTQDAISLYRPVLGEGAVDKEIARGRFDAPPDTQTWRTLTLVPAVAEDGGVLLAYVDGNPRPVLRVSLKEARIPGKPVLGVFHGEIHIKNLIAPYTGEK